MQISEIIRILELPGSEREIAFVAKKHAGQKDKAGNDYLEAHLMDVALLVPKKLRLLALAHDLFEDTDATMEEAEANGFDFEERMILLSLTKREGEMLNEYIDCVKLFPEAITIKIADVVSNLSRLGALDKRTQGRLKVKYFKTLKLLQEDHTLLPKMPT